MASGPGKVVAARRPYPPDAPSPGRPVARRDTPTGRVRPGRQHLTGPAVPPGRKCSGSSLHLSKEIVKLAQCCGRVPGEGTGSAAERDQQART